MGIEIDPKLNDSFNNGREGIISKDTARVRVYVIPTIEELLIARDTARLTRNICFGGSDRNGLDRLK